MLLPDNSAKYSFGSDNLHSHLKEEAIRQVKLKTFQQAREVIEDYIDFHTYERK